MCTNLEYIVGNSAGYVERSLLLCNALWKVQETAQSYKTTGRSGSTHDVSPHMFIVTVCVLMIIAVIHGILLLIPMCEPIHMPLVQVHSQTYGVIFHTSWTFMLTPCMLHFMMIARVASTDSRVMCPLVNRIDSTHPLCWFLIAVFCRKYVANTALFAQ